jgi:class 3 adenylate cyclase
MSDLLATALEVKLREQIADTVAAVKEIVPQLADHAADRDAKRTLTNRECYAGKVATIRVATLQGTAPERRMQFRVGINIGDVVYDETRIYGDGINVACPAGGHRRGWRHLYLKQPADNMPRFSRAPPS